MTAEGHALDAGDFLILACDGIWDVMTTEEVCDAVLSAPRSLPVPQPAGSLS